MVSCKECDGDHRSGEGGGISVDLSQKGEGSHAEKVSGHWLRWKSSKLRSTVDQREETNVSSSSSQQPHDWPEDIFC